jgi:hypothetical protein
MSLYSFHAIAHAKPKEAVAGPSVRIGNHEISTLVFPRTAIGKPFSVSFEEAAERLRHVERMDLEPDGYFLWSGAAAGRWQVDGHLYDRGHRLLMVSLKGNCPTEQFDHLLTAIGWPKTPLMFELVQEDAYVDEAEFRRYAST